MSQLVRKMRLWREFWALTRGLPLGKDDTPYGHIKSRRDFSRSVPEMQPGYLVDFEKEAL
jgi:hypothetical protein